MKRMTLFCFLCIAFSVKSQDFTANWTGFYSYFNISDVSQGNGKIYGAAENAILIYDTATQITSTVSSVNGLAGQPISTIYFSETYNLLLIGYQNGLLETLDAQGNVGSFVDIIEEISISPNIKQIYHFYEFENRAFVATGFGIVEFHLETLEFGDTFRIGDNGAELQVNQITVKEDNIYAATVNGGLRVADVNSDNLINFAEWEGITSGTFTGVVTLGVEVYTAAQNGQIFREENNMLQPEDNLGEQVIDMRVSENSLIITTLKSITIYDIQFNSIATIGELDEVTQEYAATTLLNNQVYIGHNNEGLLLLATTTTLQPQKLSPSGPIRNRIFSIEAMDNQLYAVFGEYDIFYFPEPATRIGISHLTEEDLWVNIPFEDVLGADDLSEITINPNNPSEVYFSSYGNGLLRVVDDVPEFLFDETNSNLDDIDLEDAPNFTGELRISGTAYDQQGRLWIANSLSENALNVLTNDNNIQPINIGEQIPAIEDNNIGKVVVDRNGNVFAGSQLQGLIGYQPSTGAIGQIFTSASGGSDFARNDIRGLAIDRNNRLWIGSRNGVRVLFNPQRLFTEENVTAEDIIIIENGVPQRLLAEQFVGDIEVDGSNNKWVATAASGAYYLSADGQETFLQFTTDNSPLPSNTITDITIDEASGRVYFSTPNGLLAYNTTATSPQTNLENIRAYPNPVRPSFNGNVVIDGLTANANVKITDITGNLVHEDTSIGGTMEWDTRAFGRHRVASGVYLILITADDASETQVHKLMIVR